MAVRGTATGTPTAKFWGAKPTGKSFNRMSNDIFAAQDVKLSSAFHAENGSYAREEIKT
jgi:hypothetical protein